MEEIKTTFYITNDGKLRLNNEAAFKAAVTCFPGAAGTLTLEPHRNRISHNQRKYFFGVVVEILQVFFEGTGVQCTKQDVLDLLKDRYLFREKLCPITGRFMKVPISLSDSDGAMTHQEFQKAYESIVQWGVETLNVDIPPPDPNWRMYKKEKDATSTKP